MVAPGGVQWVRWEWVGPCDGCGDKGLVVVRSWWSGGLVYVAGAFEDVVRARAISPLLEPPGNHPVVLEGVVEARPDSHLYQPIVDPLLGVIPLSPVSAQLPVSLLQLFLVEGCLSQVIDVSLHPNVVEVS